MLQFGKSNNFKDYTVIDNSNWHIYNIANTIDVFPCITRTQDEQGGYLHDIGDIGGHVAEQHTRAASSYCKGAHL